jgi:ribosomal protein S18 acetylase RimI-like enzyme
MANVVILGLIDFYRSSSAKSPLPRSDFHDDTKRVMYSSGIDFAPCNGIIEKDKTEIGNEEIKDAVRFFASRKLPFVWWTGDRSLESEGFQFGGTMKGIALDTSKPMTPAMSHLPPPGVNIKIVESEEELSDFCKVIAECFGFNSEIEKQYEKVSKIAMDQKEQVHFIAYVDEKAVSTATLTTLPGSCGIWNCATLPAYRKQGIGTALCAMASVHALELNYREVMAVLMPKGMAWGLFHQLGYEEVSSLPFYVYGAAAHELER